MKVFERRERYMVSKRWSNTIGKLLVLILAVVFVFGTGINPTIAAKEPVPSSSKVVYLTFDDGPSKHTADVLDILQKEKIKATFFVLGKQVKEHPELLKRIDAEGHAIGNHSYNHAYKKLYSDFRHFWQQIRDTGQAIKEVVGYEPRLVRAPGGTYLNFDRQYFQLLGQAGYIVHDWHVDSGDSKRSGVPKSEIMKSIRAGARLPHTVVLMHDSAGHGETVKALPDIIKFYRDKGYTFEVMTPDLEPVQFKVSSRKRWERKAVTQAWIDQHVKAVDVRGEKQPERQAEQRPGKQPRKQPEKQVVQQKDRSMRFKATTEVGMLNLQPGQYKRIQQNTYIPARILSTHLDGEIIVTDDSAPIELQFKRGTITVNRATGAAFWQVDESEREHLIWKGIEEDGVLWVPLRPVLDTIGIPLLKHEFIPLELGKIDA
ncbi:polysaccharide deacetylase [Paenibacillus sp. SC116]|uniref:polysaccharide deacetylase family protein n=1 Tax=Paenibacillus sp. SC116 TaxID=2968986 RepID=UPI00215AE9A4|nr:polysaccharide deacetylase family protein [Paenibacillus sp. SC116]MCR8846537.1 polysaccharide deacetylase [Paenibacillus sp. SC116]